MNENEIREEIKVVLERQRTRTAVRLEKYLKEEYETWTPEQAAFLVCGIDPETFQEKTYGQDFPNALSLAGEMLQGEERVLSGKNRILEIWHRQKTHLPK